MAAAGDDLLLASRVLAGANTGQTAASYVRLEPTDPAQRSRSGMGGPGAEPAEPPPPGPAAPGPQLAPPPPNLVRFTQPGSANALEIRFASPALASLANSEDYPYPVSGSYITPLRKCSTSLCVFLESSSKKPPHRIPELRLPGARRVLLRGQGLRLPRGVQAERALQDHAQLPAQVAGALGL